MEELHTVGIKLPCLDKEQYPFIFHYVEDYSSLKDCIIAVEKSLDRVYKDSYGIIVMVFTDVENLYLMPTYHSKYFIENKEVDSVEAFMSHEDVREVHTVEHKVAYTQGVADQQRLTLFYARSIDDREVFQTSYGRGTCDER